MKTVLIIAGESSGDLYGSMLAKALTISWPDIKLVGIGGEKMRAAGVETLSGISSVLGITEVVASLGALRNSLKTAKDALLKYTPDVVVLIDYPDFNFMVGKAAKKLGLKVLYYVSPQVWAWRKGRIKTMKEFVERAAVILPFEEKLYKKAGLPCEFVGHPVMEEIEQYEVGMQNTEHRSQNNKSVIKATLIALLPGSRPNELKTLLPVFIDLVRIIKKETANCKFILPLAPNIEINKFKPLLDNLESEGVTLSDNAVKALASSDAAVIASGTATLQAALLGIPMVVAYKVSSVTYFIGKNILKVKHISLANILSEKQVVSELIQKRVNANNIAEELKKILIDDKYRGRIISSLRKIRAGFSGRQPSRRVAEMIGEMAGWMPAPRKTSGANP